MKIGAATLVKGWGSKLTLKRNGVTLVTFTGRLLDPRGSRAEPEFLEFDGSTTQELLLVIGCSEDFGSVRPQKFDVVTNVTTGEEYTVQRSRSSGADQNELVKMLVMGGRA